MWDTHKMLQKLSVDVPDKLIIIEEAQFFIGLVEFVKNLVDNEGRDVVVVGLDGDYRRKPFPEILDCISLADRVTKLTALCKRCADGTPAIFTHRLSNETSQVLVGGQAT
jgi:thymidine kinase